MDSEPHQLTFWNRIFGCYSAEFGVGPRTTDTQWRHKSKKSENLGRCGRQNMLWPYLKIWEWELIFGRAVKAISSPGVRSPWVGLWLECCTAKGPPGETLLPVDDDYCHSMASLPFMSVLPTRRFDVVKTENYDWFLGRNFILFFNHWKATKVKILQFSSDGILYVQCTSRKTKNQNWVLIA